MGLISFFYGARANYCPQQWSLIHNRASKTDYNIRFHVCFPQVIGDTTARLHHEKGLHDLRKLEEALGIPIKLISVIRNPFDNIATICRRRLGVNPFRLHHEKGRHDLRKLEKVLGIPIKLINVIRNPFDNIATICRRLDVNPGSHQIVSKYRGISSSVSHWFLFFMVILDFF